jgi:hypothetical protein
MDGKFVVCAVAGIEKPNSPSRQTAVVAKVVVKQG